MQKIKKLLSQISQIVVEEKTQQEERRKRGENYNIFKVLGLSSSEVRLHSAFLAELLNPNGDHGLEDKFLKAFIEIVIGKNTLFDFDTKSAKTYVEYDIEAISEDYKEGGRIDLLIRDKKGKSIIIENKIYAGDQPWQMYRYNRYAEINYSTGNYTLLYLTLDGHRPSEESTGKDPKFNYFCISYKEDILVWLKQCIGIAALHPAIRETISQYITNLKQILNIMDNSNNAKLLDILKGNLSEAVNILSFEREIRQEVRRMYINTVLAKVARTNGFEIDDNVEDFIILKNNAVIVFKYTEEPKSSSLSGNFVLRLYGNRSSNSVYYGIMTQMKVPAVEKIWPNDWDMFPYGMRWVDDAGPLCFWDRNSTIIQMQKEIDLKDNDYSTESIWKEIDAQLKIIKKKFF